LIEYYIKTYDPRAHLSVCSIVSMLGVEIIQDSFGDPNDPDSDYYGKFYVKSPAESFDLIFDFPGVILEMPDKSTIR
jgi:hypothetical protein